MKLARAESVAAVWRLLKKAPARAKGCSLNCLVNNTSQPNLILASRSLGRRISHGASAEMQMQPMTTTAPQLAAGNRQPDPTGLVPLALAARATLLTTGDKRIATEFVCQ
jgi:hypothetical protein